MARKTDREAPQTTRQAPQTEGEAAQTDQTERKDLTAERTGEPTKPTQLAPRAWWGVLKRTVKQFQEDDLTDWAAALTYYGILSIFPGLLVLVSALGLLSDSATQSLLSNIGAIAPGPVKEILDGGVRSLEEAGSKAGISAVAVVFTGKLAEQVGKLIGMGKTAVLVWDIVKWPVLAIIVSLLFAILYSAAPNARQSGFRWITPGGVLAVLLWVAASAGFAFYVANFDSYNKTYGSLGAVIIFLVWLWISNLAVLLGAEFNAELERARAIEQGHPADEEPYVPLRDDRKIGDQTKAAGLG